MHLSEEERVAAIKALQVTLDKLTRSPKRFTPSAPWIIPAMMIFVALFAIVCIVIKLFMSYIHSKGEETPRKYGFNSSSSPDITATPEDQTSMATTASMRTRDSLKHGTQRRNKLPPVSLYQMKLKQSPSATSPGKPKISRTGNKAIARIARQKAHRSVSPDNLDQQKNNDDRSDDNANDDTNSPTNLSQHSEEIDELQVNHSGLTYNALAHGQHEDEINHQHLEKPEVHVVQIRDVDEGTKHSQPVWPQTESEI